MLQARSVTKSLSLRTLFRGISLTIQPGDRLGIVGPNGTGKSTLLKALAEEIEIDSGEIVAEPGARVVRVEQDDKFPGEKTAREILTEAGIRGAQARGEPVEPHEAEIRGDMILGKTGFPLELSDARAHTLSGGWRKRLSIAQALAETLDDPDVILLDEPTNHLDLEGIRWLEKLIARLASRKSGAAVVFITHDRDFLERASTRVAELSPIYPDGLFVVDGNYSAFLRRKAEFMNDLAKRRRVIQNQVRKDLDWLSRGPQGRGTKAQSRIDASHARIDELADLTTRTNEGDRGGSTVDFNKTGRKTRKMIVADGVTHTLGGRRLFTDVSLALGVGDRLGLLGPNGSGKTTFIRVLTGQLAPDAGTVRLADPAPEVAVFSQHRTDFEPELRLRDALCPTGDHVNFRGQLIHVKGWARRFLFKEQQLEQPVRSLSGGELARIHLARIMLVPSDVLVLDEPTNDLDIPTLETLEEALEDYPGALVLVTHDRAMLNRLATQVLAIDGLGGARAMASVDQAIDHIERTRAAALAPAKAKPAPTDHQRRRTKKLSYNEQREYDRIESDIEAAEAEATAAETALIDPEIIADHTAMHRASERLSAAHERVEALYQRWHELEAIKTGAAHA